MERNVVSLEIAKRLKAAGWQHPVRFARWPSEKGTIITNDPWDKESPRYPAPTAQEIADQLPLELSKMIGKQLNIRPLSIHRDSDGETWAAYYSDITGIYRAATLSDALAELWLALQKEPANA